MSDDKRLTPEMKAKWVAALRSGDFKQTADQLQYDEDDVSYYCCLGVLGTVCGLPYQPHDSFLSDAYLDMDTQDTLAGMNDKGDDFLKIADYIEAHL